MHESLLRDLYFYESIVSLLDIVIFRTFIGFFFQAEDGIRDLVRSRGLGDVYKRQGQLRLPHCVRVATRLRAPEPPAIWGCGRGAGLRPVSYTHLTLPTSDLV